MNVKNLLFLFLFFPVTMGMCACGGNGSNDVDIPEEPEKPEEPVVKDDKETYFPKDVWNVTYGNNYESTGSQFNTSRMAKTDNLVALWEAGFGTSPSSCADSKFRFSIDDVLKEADKMYAFYRDKLKFVEKGNSLTDKYKMLMYIYYSTDATLYGGGAENKVGVMWIYPGRVQAAPYGGIAHELGHSFQYMVAADGGWGYSSNPSGGVGQTIFEMTSQYMLWQYYPDWIVFENYHLQSFMLNTHKAFMHEDNCYSSPFVLEYWSNKHGIDFIAKLWRESKRGEDPVTTYKRLTGIDQDAFNGEMFDAYRKFITWDMDRIRTVSKDYVNIHTTAFTSIANGWYRIAEKRCPQNYGYNGVRLDVPVAGTEVVVDFKGLAGADGYRSLKADKAGWRYGFLAVKSNGQRVYGDIYSATEGKATIQVPEDTAYLWLVVSGAPAEHWEHVWDNDTSNDEQWPYQIKLTGTTLHNSVQK